LLLACATAPWEWCNEDKPASGHNRVKDAGRQPRPVPRSYLAQRQAGRGSRRMRREQDELGQVVFPASTIRYPRRAHRGANREHYRVPDDEIPPELTEADDDFISCVPPKRLRFEARLRARSMRTMRKPLRHRRRAESGCWHRCLPVDADALTVPESTKGHQHEPTANLMCSRYLAQGRGP